MLNLIMVTEGGGKKTMASGSKPPNTSVPPWKKTIAIASCCSSAALQSHRRRQRRIEKKLLSRQQSLITRASDEGDRDSAADGGEEEEDNFSLVDMLIKKSRSATEVGITTLDWHQEIYDEAPDGFETAVNEGVDFVDVIANSHAVGLVSKASLNTTPRFCVRIAPRPTFGLGLILNKEIVKTWAVLGPLKQTLDRLGVGYAEMLTLHSEGGRLGFPFWVYDAVADAFQRGLCTRVGVSHPNANLKAISRMVKELQDRGVSLSCVFVKFSLLDRRSLPLIEECRTLGLQVFAVGSLGTDELASGRYTASNPTGGEISVPRFTLAQLLPLRPLHEALESVAAQARTRCEKQIDTTQVALQWLCSKGANPLCDVGSEVNARALSGCKEWSLSEDEVVQLDKALAKLKKR